MGISPGHQDTNRKGLILRVNMSKRLRAGQTIIRAAGTFLQQEVPQVINCACMQKKD